MKKGGEGRPRRSEPMGGRPKSQRKLSWRDWKPHEEITFRQIIDDGGDYAGVAKALGRSEIGVVLHARRTNYRLTHTKAQLTAAQIGRLLGLPDQKIVGRWITAYKWLEGKKAGKYDQIYRVTWEALLTMMQDHRTWMAWQPERITDSALKEWAEELRRGKGRWLRPSEVGKLKGVGSYTPAAWIEKGLFKRDEDVVRYGNWWFWSVAVEHFVPPIDQPKIRCGAGIHQMDDWTQLHHYGKTAWVEAGRLVEESGNAVVLRRGRLTCKVPPYIGRREGVPPEMWLSPGRHPKRGEM